MRVISNLLFPLITFPYVSRKLGPDSIGLFNYIFAIASYFTLFASFGFSLYGTREISVQKNDKKTLNDVTNTLMTGNLLIAIGVYIFYLIFCFFIISDNRILFIIAGFLIILTPLSFEWFYQGMEDFKYITVRGIIIKSISLVCLFLFVKDSSDLLIYLILTVSAVSGNNVLNLLRLRKYIKLQLNINGVWKHIKGASVFFLGNIAISFYSYMNDIIVGLMDNMEAVGYFSTGNKIVHILLQILGVITISIMPRMSYLVGGCNMENATRLRKKTINMIMYVALPTAVGLFIIAKPIVLLFAGSKFIPACGVIHILTPLIVIISVSQFFGNQILIPNRKEKYGNYAVMIGAVVNVCLALLFVPKYSFYGVAVSLLSAETVVTLLMGYFSSKYVKFEIKDYLPINAILSSIIMGGFLLFIYDLCQSVPFILVNILIGVSVYVMALIVMNDKFAKHEIFIPVMKKLKLMN